MFLSRRTILSENVPSVGVRPVVLRELFFRLQTEIFFAFKLVFAPQSEEIKPALLGMSLTNLAEVPRPVSLFARVAVSRISD